MGCTSTSILGCKPGEIVTGVPNFMDGPKSSASSMHHMDMAPLREFKALPISNIAQCA